MSSTARLTTTLYTLAERSADGYLLAAVDGEIQYANAAARAILAIEGESIVGTSITRWIPELDFPVPHPVSEVETDGFSSKEDRFPLEAAVTPVEEGHAWIVFRDISRRRGFEGSVRKYADELERMIETRTRERDELRSRYRALYDLAPVLDIELDSQGSIASANRKSCLSLGVSIDRLVGLPLSDLAVPDKREEFAKALTRMREGSPSPFETRIRSADGSVLDVLFHPGQSEPGAGALRLVGLDVTGRREAERLVDQSLDLAEAQRARMERILRGIGDGVVVTDPDGQVRLMNEIAERFLDIDEPFAFGRDLFSEQRDADFVAAWNDYTSKDEDLFSSELTIGGNTPRVFSVTISRIRTPEGRPAGYVSVLRDVTKERQIERMKRDFISNITHELRTPLASIRGFTSTILRADGVTAEDQHRFLGIVEKEAERLQHLIEDLLALSSLEAGRETLNLRPANLGDLLRDAKQMFAPIASDKGVALEISIRDKGAGIFDPEKMRRVIDNLISNALKHTPRGGRIDVELDCRDEKIECVVRDTGKGMIPEVLEHIFERFYSVDPTQPAQTSGNPWGSGLGLHIVQKLVDLHGGEIHAESRLGEGSRFRFSLPAVPVLRGQAPGREADPDPSDPLLDDPGPALPAPLAPGED